VRAAGEDGIRPELRDGHLQGVGQQALIAVAPVIGGHGDLYPKGFKVVPAQQVMTAAAA
jgi:hypothetical protein